MLFLNFNNHIQYYRLIKLNWLSNRLTFKKFKYLKYELTKLLVYKVKNH